jgi:hypothetical protein
MRVLVCGGRDFNDYEYFEAVLTTISLSMPITCIIHGDASGADSLAGKWAEKKNIQVEKYPADWKALGRAAGPIRNKQMIDEGKPDLVVAFPGGRGTSNMVSLTKKSGIDLLEV